MAISKEKLAAIIQNNRQLCNSAGDRLVNSKKNNNFRNDDYSNVNYDTTINETYNYEESNIMTDTVDFSKENFDNSKLPDKIKESFKNNKIDTTKLAGFSILDELNIKPQNKQVVENKQVVNEIQHIQQPSQQQIIQNTQPIDYSIIKAIVNECLREQLSHQVINESANLNSIKIEQGTISLIDNKGNVFRAKLEKIANLNEIKEK